MRQTIKTLAAEIKRLWPDLDVQVEQGYCNTDRKIPGTRLRHPGKGRRGARLIVRDPNQIEEGSQAGWLDRRRVLLDHNNAETYRHTGEVRQWIDDRLAGRKSTRGYGS